MAKMCGTLVRIWRSTGMKPRSVTCTPAFSASIFLPFGERPTATSTRSKVLCASAGAWPSSAASKVTVMPLASAVTPEALVFR
ncbi:hypothetical protein G6F62_015750 [Rhizopus arrhizus]|nr:hypothetical protein G6F62_015750 [Rhizopus arrhizus]